MKTIFSFVWAALCAWAMVMLLLWLDTKLDLREIWFFPEMLEWFRNSGLPFSFRQLLFFGLLLTFLFTGLHKYIGQGILFMIGVVCILVVAILVIFFGYHFVMWLAGTL